MNSLEGVVMERHLGGTGRDAESSGVGERTGREAVSGAREEVLGVGGKWVVVRPAIIRTHIP